VRNAQPEPPKILKSQTPNESNHVISLLQADPLEIASVLWADKLS